METIDRARRPVRRRIDLLLQELGTTLSAKPVDKATVTGKFSIIEKEYSRLEALDQEARDHLLTANATEEAEEKEFRETNAYQERVEIMRAKVAELFVTPAEVIQQSSSASVVGDSEGLGIKLPKYDLPKFDGKLINWLGFWANFKNVDECTRLDGSVKFNYLKSSLVRDTPPYKMICDLPATSENYVEVVEKLKEEYGDSNILLQVYISEMLKLVIGSASSQEEQDPESLLHKADSHYRALKSLELDKADPATWLYPLMESSLPRSVLGLWMRSAEYREKPTKDRTRVDILFEFWRKEVNNLRRIRMAEKAFKGEAEDTGSTSSSRSYPNSKDMGKRFSVSRKDRRTEPYPTLKGFQNVVRRGSNFGEQNLARGSGRDKQGMITERRLECVFCNGTNHFSRECYKLNQMSNADKRKKVIERGVCWNCFGNNHTARDCKSAKRCHNCGMKHNTTICTYGYQPINQTINQPINQPTYQPKLREPALESIKPTNIGKQTGLRKPIPSGSNELITQNDHANRVKACSVSLQTVQAYIKQGGKKLRVRLFFDVGSQRSYIRKATAQLLRLPVKGTEVVAHEVFGGSTTRGIVHQLHEVQLCSLDETVGRGTYHCNVELRDQETISSSISGIPNLDNLGTEPLKEMGIWFSDTGEICQPIDILIGADLFGKLLTGQLQQLNDGRVAIETKFGWTLVGEEGKQFMEWYEEERVSIMSVRDYYITQLWDLDTIGIRDPTDVKTKTQEEKEVLERFIAGIKRNEDGRYLVRLPWKDGHPPLPDNWVEAEKRLRRTDRKLKESGLFETYNQLFLEWEAEGFIEEVGKSPGFGITHYIPHRAVIKDSLTTPVRPVFDASCKVGRVPSLNDCLHKGSNFILKIPQVMAGFRKLEIGFVADIRKAFQMIEVAEEDRNAMRFLWLDAAGNIKVYRHRRVMFGANCSPFILGATLDYYLSNLKDEQEIGSKLLRAMYVDNCCTSTTSYRDYDLFRNKATKILAECGMDLRMWMSNMDEFDDPKTETISVLGIQWDRKEDSLFVKTEGITLPDKITKRTVLSVVQKVFDTIGTTCPALIPIKHLLQGAFLQRYKWDQALPEKQANQFCEWVNEVGYLQQIRIPRRITDIKTGRGDWSMHVFTDASSIAYGAVIYIRVQDGDYVSVRLLTAKARISPIIPRKSQFLDWS